MGHYERTQEYQKALNAHEAWVINFTRRLPAKGYLWPNSTLVRAIHVYHKLDWTEAVVVTSGEALNLFIQHTEKVYKFLFI